MLTTLWIITTLLGVSAGPNDYSKKQGRCAGGTELREPISKNERGKVQYTGTIRHYCLAVTEVNWNYAPIDYGVSFDIPYDGFDNSTVTSQYAQRTLSELTTTTYKKELFKKFAYVSPTSSSPGYCNWTNIIELEPHLGFIGPPIRAIVTDTVIVHIRNSALNESIPFHAHGLSPISGRKCQDNFEIINNITVPTIGECVHKFYANYSSGTGLGIQSSTTAWMYTVSSSSNDGSLIGPIIIVNPKFSVSSNDVTEALACDIDQEFFLYLTETDETASKFFIENLNNDPTFSSLTAQEQNNLLLDTNYLSSHIKYSINGFTYNSLGASQGLKLVKNMNVRWHIISHSYGTSYTQQYIYNIHWYGNNIMDISGNFIDTVTATEGRFQSYDMTPYTSGIWDIIILGKEPLYSSMRASYSVIEPEVVVTNPSASSSSNSKSSSYSNNQKYSKSTKKIIEQVTIAASCVSAMAAIFIGLVVFRSHIESRVLSFLGHDTHSSRSDFCCLPFEDFANMSSHPTTALVSATATATATATHPMMQNPIVHIATAEVIIKNGINQSSYNDDHDHVHDNNNDVHERI